MPITFTRCPTVEPGDAITSSQLAGLAAAFNDRLKSGLGDPTYRIAFYLFGATRQIRNSDGGTLFPPQGEFFEQYQALTAAEGEWPVASAGDPEGINVSSPLGAFVFGNESADIDAEIDRIDGLAYLLDGETPATLADYWRLGQLQRGAVDPETGAIASPAFDAARLHMRIAYDVRAPYGNSYGGFQPLPEYGATPCASAGSYTPANLIYKFTSLIDGSSVSYLGSCPEEPTHVGRILRLSDLYIVVKNNGEQDYYRRNEWIEGPYTGGGSLTRDVGFQLDRAIDRFAKDFRGTEAQRERGWNRNAFDFQKFLTRQYSLAPNRGQSDGTYITATYPTFQFSNDQGPGAAQGYTYATGYVLDSIYIRAEGVIGTISIEIIDNDDNVLATVEAAADADGLAEAIEWLDRPIYPDAIRVRLAGPLRFTGGTGTLTVQLTELYPYKPNASDAYAILRVASAKSGTVNGSGLEETGAKEIWDTYRAYGCVMSGPGLPVEDAVINTNAVYDAFRRMSKCVRILSREQLIGYELEGGKSVLYFLRNNRVNADSFDGIGPSRLPISSGALVAGKTYESHDGTVYYKGEPYADRTPFKCERDDLTFAGQTYVYESNGIQETAPVASFSNRWLVGFQFKAYHMSESSIWKPSAFSDYFTFSDRCHFYHGTYPSSLTEHLDYGAALSLSPEGAPGYRYASGTNIISCAPLDTPCIDAKIDRYQSCQLYDPDIEIESATSLIESGEEVIKLVLKSRLHYADDAVGTIARDVTTWDTAALRAESYRSTENAIREYILWRYNGTNAVAGKLGDSAVGSGVDSLPDNPHGTVFPSIFLTQLLPSPYLDGNGRQNAVDSKLLNDTLSQAELYLRAMCEGYVDDRTSEEYACASGISSWYDYTFPNLCFDAFQGQWLTMLATETTQYLNASKIREDAPQGFGPYPNTYAASEVWNQFARAVNLLTRVRVMLPMEFETETRSEGDAPLGYYPATDANGMAEVCGGYVGNTWVSTISVTQDIPSTVTVPRTTATSASSLQTIAYELAPSYVCSGGNFAVDLTRQEDDYWLDLLDDDSRYAMPIGWRTDFETNGEALFTVTTTETRRLARIVAAGGGTDCNGAEPFIDGVTTWLLEDVSTSDITCEMLPMQGTVPMPSLGTVNLYGQFVGGSECTESVNVTRSIEPVNTDAFVLAIDLVDPAEETAP